MSCRQSARKVKLTSKFEEFSTSRLASIQRLAHPEAQPTVQPEAQATVATPQPKIEREAITKVVETKAPETPINHAATPRERTSTYKALRLKSAVTPATAPTTPATPAYEKSITPTPYSHMNSMPKLTANGKIRGRPRKCWQKAETVVKPISSTREELLRLREENSNLKTQLEEKNVEYEDLKRNSSYTGQTVPKADYDDLKEKYQRDMTHAKRHEWCVVCLSPSRYHCCWNTTYCSQKCQVEDWYIRHGKSCERRRAQTQRVAH